MNDATRDLRPAPWEDERAFGVYVHVPWCPSRCSYCDFVIRVDRRIPHEAYADALLAELADRAARFRGLRLVSIYFGGGTPSLWRPDCLARAIRSLVDAFGDDHLAEVTMEANPSVALPSQLAGWIDAGVNRVSLGVQCLDDTALQALNRRHDAATAERCVKALATEPRLRSFTVDLIVGLPGLDAQAACRDAATLLDLGAPHLSTYALTVEANTRLAHQVARSDVALPDDGEVADQLVAVRALLGGRGVEPYELSSAARSGHRAIHNSLYWHMRPYMGLGVGAHGLEPIGGATAWGEQRLVRRRNRPQLERYLRAPAEAAEEEEQRRADRLTDCLITGLRWLDGLPWSRIRRYAQESEIVALRQAAVPLQRAALLDDDGDVIRLTERGRLLSDKVLVELAAAL